MIDCGTRTFLIPTIDFYEGPLATGELKKSKQYMKEPKVSGDLTPEDHVYFCEGQNPLPLANQKPRRPGE